MKERFDKLIPKYSRIPLVLVVLFNISAYYLTRPINVHLEHYSLETAIDRALPFVPEFIYIYILAYLQWVIGYIVIARESRENCYRFLTAEMVAKIICMVFYIVYPTAIVLPELSGGSFSELVTGLIYSADIPNNLFPSVHCLASYMCFRGVIKAKKVGFAYKIGSLIFAILVFLSTVFVKQHYFVDIIGGIVVVELGILLTDLFKLNKILPKVNKIASKFRGGNYYE